MNLLEDYICDVTINERVFTVTNNDKVLRAFNIQSSINSAYDFRSKKIIDIRDYTDIIPTSSLLNYNPYICNDDVHKKIILDHQVKKAYLYYNIPGEKFSNTCTGEYSNRFAFLREIIQASPFFDLDTYDYLCQDDGAFKWFIESDFDIIQRICMSVVHEEVGISVEELLKSNVEELIQRVKFFWLQHLNVIKEKHLLDIQNLLQVYKQKPENSLKELFTINELQKEYDSYKNIDIEKDLNTINLIYDIYRYFPFNETNELTYKSFISQFSCLSKFLDKPVNRWHHKQFLIVKKLMPTFMLTYSHIEHNDQVIVNELNKIKLNSISETKNSLHRILTEEYEQFKNECDELSIAVANDIQTIREKVLGVELTCKSKLITDIINYWPPVLGKIPEVFVQ